jgi:hypothetical protein
MTQMMTVAVQVEATPALVEDHLRKYAATLGSAGAFPVPSGTMVDLRPEVAQAIGALKGAKVLVIEASQKSPHAFVAFVKSAGGFGAFWAIASQIVPPPADGAQAAPAAPTPPGGPTAAATA